MKKLFALLMALVFACTFLTAVCETAAPLRIVCTTFPQYDWTRQLLGDRADDVELTLLLDNGIDLHNYQPTADDIIKIARSDLFIYVGGESDAWVNDLLETSQNSHVKALSMLACVDAKEEEAVEGMQEEAHECGHAHHEAEYDEHVWLSLRNAQTITRAIADALCEADPAHAETYRANANAYIAQLAELDAQYADMVRHAARSTILFADRFPFRYLADSRKIEPGCLFFCIPGMHFDAHEYAPEAVSSTGHSYITHSSARFWRRMRSHAASVCSSTYTSSI